MVILLCYTSAFSEVDFYANILDCNFCIVDENSQILVVVFLIKLNFSFSFRFVDENCGIFVVVVVVVVVVVFVTKINLFSSTKIFVFVVVDEKNTGSYALQWLCYSCHCDCSLGVEDAFHFLFKCPAHFANRTRLFTEIQEIPQMV